MAAISSVASTIGSALSRRIKSAALAVSTRAGNANGDELEDDDDLRSRLQAGGDVLSEQPSYVPGSGIRSLMSDLIGGVSAGGRSLSAAMQLDAVGKMVSGAGTLAMSAAQDALRRAGQQEDAVLNDVGVCNDGPICEEHGSAGHTLLARIYREKF